MILEPEIVPVQPILQQYQSTIVVSIVDKFIHHVLGYLSMVECSRVLVRQCMHFVREYRDVWQKDRIYRYVVDWRFQVRAEHAHQDNVAVYR